MRNLKKILALVLALVMSLSLMATAGASQFPDVDESNPYATAIDVLDELKVFQGFDDGTFKPTDTLNRAQAAVLVYRIATGDVDNKYLDNYTYMAQSKFNDLEGYNWAKGYINYCQNAGIVVGTSATTFDPGAKVTGYQLLVMLLRTLGYGKAGEFADPKGWELQTATIAEREGITKNVTGGDFGAPAPRQMVAEILFRGLLTDTVEYSALIPGGYTKSGVTLGMREFGLEKISGVVMANEWANLDGDSVAKADTTVLKVDGKDVTVNRGTDLDAVGLTYNAYIANGGENGTKRALTLEAGDNTVAFNEGKATGPDTDYAANREWATIEKLAGTESISIKDSTEYYLNYAQDWNEDCTSDYQIGYVVNWDNVSATAFAAVADDADAWKAAMTAAEGTVVRGTLQAAAVSGAITRGEYEDLAEALADVAVLNNAKTQYSKSIRPEKTITEDDQLIMQYIFYVAGRYGDNPEGVTTYYSIGEVYVGTTERKDYSDTMSWKAFKAEYFLDTKTSRRFTSAENGESLRIVDNNNDGTAEYVLKITYAMDQAIGTYKDVLQYNALNLKASNVDEITYIDEIAVGDVIVSSLIDGRVTIWKAETDTDKIQTKTFKNITVTTEGGETYGQSGIANNTGMDQLILNMNEKTEYIMYKDRFGFVRAYALAAGTQYALLTEMYPTGTQNWNYVKKTSATVELKAGDTAIEEYAVAGGTDNLFFNDSVWTSHIRYNTGNYNYLQPAIAHLGLMKNQLTPYVYNTGSTTGAAYIDWGRNVYAPVADVNGFIGVFDYGQVKYGAPTATTGPVALPNASAGTAAHSFSFTNVAVYSMNDDESVNLSTAAKLAKTQNGEQIYYYTSDIGAKVTKTWESKWIEDGGTTDTFKAAVNNGTLTPVYAVDYVQLDAQKIAAGTRHYQINKDYETNYKASANGYVDATVNTEYYIVSASGATYKVGYDNIPEILAKDIRAAYAVAKNTSYAEDGRDYWVADVIVIEVNGLVNNYDSISLMYYNPWETSGSVRYVNSLNNEWTALQPDYEDQAKMDVVPSGSGSQYTWGNTSWSSSDYGFYKLFDTELETEGTLKAGSVEKIESDWNDYGIHAGTVQRIKGILNSSGYIDVDTQGRTYNGTPISDSWVKHLSVRNVPIYRVEKTDAGTLELSEIESYNEVLLGDQLIWVYNVAQKQLSYIVDLGSRTKSAHGFNYSPETWLWNTYLDIIDEQINAGLTDLEVLLGVTGTETLTVSNVKSNKGAGSTKGTNPVKLVVPEDATTVQFTVTPSTGIAPEDLIVTPADGWELYNRQTAANGTDLEVTIVKISQIQTLSLSDTVKNIPATNTVMTNSYFTTVVLADINKLAADYAAADAAGKEALAKDMAIAKEILAAAKAGTDASNDTALDAIAAAEAEIAYATGEATRPTDEETAGAKLVEKYTAWFMATGTAKEAALEEMLEAAVAYKPFYPTTTPTTPTQAQVAYAAAVEVIDELVGAVDTANTAMTSAADADKLEKINDLVEAVKAADAYSDYLTIATGWNDTKQTAYNGLVEKLPTWENLVTLAEALVKAYNAWYTATTDKPAKLVELEKALADVDALKPADRTIITSSTWQIVDGSTTTPKTAYEAAVEATKDELPEAVAGVVTLTESLTLVEPLDLTDVTKIDLNGKDITFENLDTGNAAIAFNSGTLEITGKGTISTKGTEKYVAQMSGTAKLIVGKDVTLEADEGESPVIATGQADSTGVEIVLNGHLKGGVGIATGGLSTNSKVTINAGASITSNDWAIYAPGNNQQITINGGTIYGAMGGIEISGGNVDIRGGTISYGENGIYMEDERPHPSGGSASVNAAVSLTPYAGRDVTVSIGSGADLRGTYLLGFCLRSALSAYTGCDVSAVFPKSVIGDSVTFIGSQSDWTISEPNAIGQVTISLNAPTTP